jgi:hypothetical protein
MDACDMGQAGGCRGNRQFRNPAAIRICLSAASVFPYTMMFHCVYFYLKPELTAEQRADFWRGVKTLAGIRHVTKVAIGPPAGTEARGVVEKGFDCALIIEFRDVAAHNAYQVDPVHLAFVETCKGYWNRVQVYDSE